MMLFIFSQGKEESVIIILLDFNNNVVIGFFLHTSLIPIIDFRLLYYCMLLLLRGLLCSMDKQGVRGGENEGMKFKFAAQIVIDFGICISAWQVKSS